MTRRIDESLWALAAIGCVLLLFHWTVGTVGGLARPSLEPAANDYYNLLVRGFVQGHLYMDAPVSDALKALPDPYDPAQNELHRMTDASYFQGRYYLYFGAAPAVTLLLPFRLVTGLYLPTPWAILVFSWIGFLAASTVWLALRRRYLHTAPLWTVPIGILLIGVGGTAGVLLRRPFFWELATAGGYAFAMLGVAALYAAIHSDRRRAWWMGAAGVFLGLAVASRPTYVYAVPALAVPLLAWAQCEGMTRRWWRMAAAGAAGIGVMGIAVFAYNYARFGNGFEFGHNYLLSVAYESKVRLFSIEHFLFNARMYFLLPGQWSWTPPFFAPVPVMRAEMPEGFYTVDDPFGLLTVFPIAIAALCAPLTLRGRREEEQITLRAVLLTFAIVTITAGTVILLYVATIPRYAVDFLPGLMLLAATGTAWLASGSGVSRLCSLRRVTVLLVSVLSLLAGTLAIFDVGRLLRQKYPDVTRHITAVTRRLESAQDRIGGAHFGPVEVRVQFVEQPAGKLETLLEGGDPVQLDRVLVEYGPDGTIRLGFQHAEGTRLWSQPIGTSHSAEHRITVELGSFYPHVEHAFFSRTTKAQAAVLQRRVAIAFDGAAVIDTFAPLQPSRRGAPDSVAADFSGRVVELRRITIDPASRAISAPKAELLLGSTEKPGGSLMLRMLFPKGVKGSWQPILSAGRNGAADVLSVYYMGPDVVQFRFDHWGAPMVMAKSIRVDESIGHELEVYLPSFSPTAFGKEATGDVWVRLDGQEVLRTSSAAFGFNPDQLILGENRVRATMDDPLFRGAFVEATWQAIPPR